MRRREYLSCLAHILTGFSFVALWAEVLRMSRWRFLLHVFESCSNRISLIQLHSVIIKTGYIKHTFIAAKLSNSYSKYASFSDTRKLFDEIPQPTIYIWNSILRSYCNNRLYEETLHLFLTMLPTQKPDHVTIPIALKVCSRLRRLEFGEMIHGFVEKSAYIGSHLFVGSALIDLYSKCGLMGDALRVFEGFDEPDIVMWTSIVTGYEQNGDPREALAFFTRMVMVDLVGCDSVTLISVVSACTQLLNVKAGRSVHGYLIRMGFESELSLANALLNLYEKTGLVNAAANLFRKMEEKDVISWASMIACYAHNGVADEALKLFNDMIKKNIEPNSVTLISALQACEASGNLDEGKKIHEVAARKGLERDILVSTALIDMYMNCSSPDEAIELFERIPNKDGVSWAALLCGCAQNGMSHKSFGIFSNMLANEIRPDVILMVKILTACSELGILQQAQCLHSYVIRGGFENNVFVGASLIETYSKCGNLNNAIKVFSRLNNKDVVVWSSMIAGYGIHGQGTEALELYEKMVKSSTVKPNNVTFLSVLSACSHAGLLSKGIELFHVMVNEYQLTPESNHYAIMVDLFGRTGQLDKAMGIIDQMEAPVGPHIWGALLGACRIHHNPRLGEVAARNLLQSDPDQAGYYILLSNIYAVEGDWDNVGKLRTLIKQMGLKKISGQSIVEVRSEVHSFTAGEKAHPQSELIYGLLRVLDKRMREEHFSPDVGFMLDDAED